MVGDVSRVRYKVGIFGEWHALCNVLVLTHITGGVGILSCIGPDKFKTGSFLVSLFACRRLELLTKHELYL